MTQGEYRGFVGNGMVLNRPGLMEFDKSFSRGDKILLVDRKGKGIGIAEALIDSDSIGLQ